MVAKGDAKTAGKYIIITLKTTIETAIFKYLYKYIAAKLINTHPGPLDDGILIILYLLCIETWLKKRKRQ